MFHMTEHVFHRGCPYNQDVLTWVISVTTSIHTSMMTPVTSTPAVINNYSIFNRTGKYNISVSTYVQWNPVNTTTFRPWKTGCINGMVAL